ncbi:MAG TPA: hypothetical protein PL033_14420 [Candidatus Brocadiia bacterium]|nr:hypothetical protein [Candidatus Brocadiia bacterium]
MPVFKSGQDCAPQWCELEDFDIIELPPGGKAKFSRVALREKLIVTSGTCDLTFGNKTVRAKKGDCLDLDADAGSFEVVSASPDCAVVRMSGRWGEHTGGFGLFSVTRCDSPRDGGDPAGYAKATNFDSHYHDCDEYWIIVKGCGIAVSEGRAYIVGPGDCVATGMGHHHDFPQVFEPVEAVYFETTMQGRKRAGHLWEHAHGPAEPEKERI